MPFAMLEARPASCTNRQGEAIQRGKMNGINGLLHTGWNCKCHMLVGLPPKIAAASFKGRLKGENSLMPCGKLPGLKCKCQNECS